MIERAYLLGLRLGAFLGRREGRYARLAKARRVWELVVEELSRGVEDGLRQKGRP